MNRLEHHLVQVQKRAVLVDAGVIVLNVMKLRKLHVVQVL
jgi:hypothetical protein